MKAIFKDNKRLLIRNLNADDKVLVNSFVDKFTEFKVTLTELTDVDDNLDGVAFTVTEIPRKKIDYIIPFVQILMQDSTTTFDLGTDEQTFISITNEYRDRITVTLEGTKVSIYARDIEALLGTTQQYVIYITLTKEGCEQTTIPVNVIVVYREFIMSYNELDDLPKINRVTVVDNKTLSQYGIQEEMDNVTNSDIQDIINNVFR